MLNMHVTYNQGFLLPGICLIEMHKYVHKGYVHAQKHIFNSQI